GETDHKTYYDYTLKMNQAVNFDLETNEKITLVGGQQKTITKLTWDVMENDENLTAEVASEIKGYKAYKIQDKEGHYEVATIYISEDQKEGTNQSEISGRHIYVETAKDTKPKDANAITLRGTYYLSTDSSAAHIRDLRLRFNTDQLAKADNLYLDFEKAGWKSDINYRKVYDKNVKADVYYFESDNGNLDLSAATFSDNVGVCSFEESKEEYQFSKGGAYKISYYLSKLPDATFGKEATTKKYTNTELLENATYVNQNDKALVANDTLKKTGIGYFVLTMDAKGEGGESVTINNGEPYYFRFLSPSNKLKSDFSVRKGSDGEYDLRDAVKEVVHIRQGEAADPGFFELKGTEFSSVDEITARDPYIEYEISDKTIAEEFSDSQLKSYRINGLSSGIVTVTASGAINKSNVKTFTLYVNKDIMTGEFSLSFTEAEAQNLINTDGVIDGKQNAVPVSVQPITNGFGISNLSWSLAWKDPAGNDPDLDSIAVINSKTGVITTKNTSGGKVITATAVSGTNTDSIDFTVGKVEGKSIKTLAEKPSADGSTVLTNTSNNAGTCKVGQTFTLYASEYDAPNVTTLSGETTWTSGDTSKATVDSKGTVTALAETGTEPVIITASYVAEGKAPVETKFNLTISGYAYSLTGINAADLTLDYVGATKAITLSFTPSTVSDREKEVTYMSSDEKVARVSNTGQVTAIGVGTCTITIVSAIDSSIQKKITVTVKGVSSTPTQTPPNTQQTQATPKPVNDIPATNTKVSSAGCDFVVTASGASGGEVAMSKAKNAKTVTVPDTVTVSGKKYKVTSIKANAFKGNKKLKSVIIGKNVKSIGKNAFNGCKKLTKVTVKSKVLKSIGKKAFAKGSKKITVIVPKKKAKAYKKLFKKSGISKKAKYKKK
ncbi:MAG: leucine-rich repeat protein, partial [Lachnospiraceae bacterium]|nr:leucine-rich repeat protein [Lachnospiraceae bacterium]